MSHSKLDLRHRNQTSPLFLSYLEISRLITSWLIALVCIPPQLLLIGPDENVKTPQKTVDVDRFKAEAVDIWAAFAHHRQCHDIHCLGLRQCCSQQTTSWNYQCLSMLSNFRYRNVYHRANIHGVFWKYRVQTNKTLKLCCFTRVSGPSPVYPGDNWTPSNVHCLA